MGRPNGLKIIKKLNHKIIKKYISDRRSYNFKINFRITFSNLKVGVWPCEERSDQKE